jgi:hypothetical protein
MLLQKRILRLEQNTQSNSVITSWKGLNILCRYKRALSLQTVSIWSLRRGASAVRLIHKCVEMDACGQITLINRDCSCRSVFCVTYDWVTHSIRFVMLLRTFLFIPVSRPATWNGTLQPTLSRTHSYANQNACAHTKAQICKKPYSF